MIREQSSGHQPRGVMERLLPYEAHGLEPMLQHGMMVYTRTMYRFIAAHTRRKHILEVGCGAGYGLAMLGKHDPDRYWGIDLAAEPVEFAARYYPILAPRLIVGDSLHLPFPDDQFDLVASLEVIEHVPSAEAFLQEIKRVMRPGATCMISTPNRLIASQGHQQPYNPYHTREYSYEEYRDLLQALFPYVEIHCIYITERVFQVRYLGQYVQWRPPFPLAHLERYCAWRFWPWTHRRPTLNDAAIRRNYRPDCVGFLARCSLAPLD